MKHNTITTHDAKLKLEHYCAYQERCHLDVSTKLRELNIHQNDADEIIVYLINNNYLNEERFACSFARGKNRIKNWGKVRIIAELKARHISQTNINRALKEIDQDDYINGFDAISERHWMSIREANALKKRKKFCDYLLRKGYESDLIYEKVKALEALP